MDDGVIEGILIKQVSRRPGPNKDLEPLVLYEGNEWYPNGLGKLSLFLVNSVSDPVITDKLLVNVFVPNLELHIVDLVVSVSLDFFY